MYNIDDILQPVASDKIAPNTPPIRTNKIERIPSLIDFTTQLFSTEFVSFFNQVVSCVSEDNWAQLYEISDRCISEDRFSQEIENKINPVWTLYKNANPECKSLDIEVDVESLQALSRNIYFKLNVMFYIISESDSDIQSSTVVKMNTYHTQLYVGYKNKNFHILSKFTEFSTL